MDPDPAPGGPKTYGSDGPGSATLVLKYLPVSGEERLALEFSAHNENLSKVSLLDPTNEFYLKSYPNIQLLL
jgi:hypothetical protein